MLSREEGGAPSSSTVLLADGFAQLERVRGDPRRTAGGWRRGSMCWFTLRLIGGEALRSELLSRGEKVEVERRGREEKVEMS